MDENGQVYADVEDRVSEADAARLAEAQAAEKRRGVENRLRRPASSTVAQAEGKVPRGGEAK